MKQTRRKHKFYLKIKYLRRFLVDAKTKIIKRNNKLTIIFIVAPCILRIHWILHTNKCTNCISYISLKLFTLKHLICSYIFR